MLGETSLALQKLRRKMLHVIFRQLPLSPSEGQNSRRQDPHEIVNPKIRRIDYPQKLWMRLRHLQHLDLAGSTAINITFCLCQMNSMDELLKIHHRHLRAARRA